MLCLQEKHGREADAELLSRQELPESTHRWNHGPAGVGGLPGFVRHETLHGNELEHGCIMQGRVPRLRRARSRVALRVW